MWKNVVDSEREQTKRVRCREGAVFAQDNKDNNTTTRNI